MTKSREQAEQVSVDEQTALRRVVEGTASDTGESFFRSLVQNLRGALGTKGAWVATVEQSRSALRAVAMCVNDEWVDDYTYEVAGTPCQTALEERRLLHIPDRIVDFYRGYPPLEAFGAVSYLGVPLFDAHGKIIGQLAVLDDKPMPPEPRCLAIFEIFANRAAAELQRVGAERTLVEREVQLRSLLDGAMDAIIDFDVEFRVSLMNPAAERVFGRTAGAERDLDVRELFGGDSRNRLERCVLELCDPQATRPSQWIAGGLGALLPDGRAFQAEATLSCYELHAQRRLTLILRDVEERLAAEQRIVRLTREAEQLREELAALQSHARIVGSSPSLLRALHEADQVATTEATVLLLGETGTGKELFARAIHEHGKRREKPLVRVNCGAIPHALIESELFGHEKGAFTGATQRREGRFAIAHGGTLFLDEIGELPLDLQPKLLRVLQEGELEPVGSSRTMSVDVRIIAATHRDLAECVRRGTFREDLYYRLSVFPIVIPPLRERDGDVDELARVFLEKFARQMGRTFAPLSESALERLRTYNWPGNVRELANVIERGVIVSKNGVFDIDRALPRATLRSERPRADTTARVRTVDELLALERENIERALQKTEGKVAGPNGAAALLGTHPSTLSSRMRSLGIKRPLR